MDHTIKDFIKIIKSMVMDFFNGMITLNIRDNLLMIICKDLAIIYGLVKKNM